jgi:hypothetical protein
MLTVYSDNAIEASWFENLLPIELKKDVSSETIGDRGTNPQHIENLINYDRPDIVFCRGNKPLLVVEKTREVPTGHNVGQRIARLVRSVEQGIPAIKFFPFDARKHGEFSGVCNLNVRILKAFERMTIIHKTPIMAINWPSCDDGELVCDGSEDEELKNLITDFCDHKWMKNAPCFDRVLQANKQEYKQRVARRRSYQSPPPSLRLVRSAEYVAEVAPILSKRCKAELLSKRESAVYIIGMTEENCRREDPYTGTQFIYDYCYCRQGPAPEMKHSNLILQFPNIRKSVWLAKNPNDLNRKSCNWYLVASALIFSDGDIFLR